MFILPGHDNIKRHVAHCFGARWKWSDVIITPQGVKLFGTEYIGGPTIDFTEQIGVYILGNDDDPMVCQGWISSSLGKTLETHAPEFFSGQYNQFTWIGLRPVFQGKLNCDPMYPQPLVMHDGENPVEDIMTGYIQAK